MSEDKVFSSNIIRNQKCTQSNLYDLIHITPAKPISIDKTEVNACDFQPKSDKYYVPKKKSRLKVRTVKDIRDSYEKDVYSYLPQELEKQQNILLRKIRSGFSGDENTKTLARQILKLDTPISRSAWEMIVNLNPDSYKYCSQYVLWNGNPIKVNGSKGGKRKFICKHDLGDNVEYLKIKSHSKRNGSLKKKCLLNSLSVNFKPGPLIRKRYLDNSYQKYHVGSTEIVNLPKPGLDIQPTYGGQLELTMINFLNNLRDEDGVMSEKWAELAASMLGTLKNTEAVQINKECITFDLNYQRNQCQILMRRDVEDSHERREYKTNHNLYYNISDQEVITSEVKNVINDLIDAVEIHLKQDNMYLIEDEPKEKIRDDISKVTRLSFTKEKSRKKCTELERLDVTVIRLSETYHEKTSELCCKPYCSLGCICASLEYTYKIKRHCGRIECMFQCKCDFSKYVFSDSFDREHLELIPGLLNMDNAINSKLSKEEKKFHQTVIMTGEKSVVLKTPKRNWKASKKYAEFYNTMCLKSEIKLERLPSVVVPKLNCENIESWCMVHGLYRCFCKGKFTKSSTYDMATVDENKNQSIAGESEQVNFGDSIHENNDDEIQHELRPTREPEKNYAVSKSHKKMKNSESDDSFNSMHKYDTDICARTIPFNGRKYIDTYYINVHNKVAEIEKNDDSLRKRMIYLINKSSKDNTNGEDAEDNILREDNIDTLNAPNKIIKQKIMKKCKNVSVVAKMNKETIKSFPVRLRSQSDLANWVESCYKQYKESYKKNVKISLQRPTFGKIALYPWDFIASRYKERKNFFLVSKQIPIRIFMSVNINKPLFDDCMNIDDIRFADLHKYPNTVKNLLTNSNDLQENFCLLCGLSECWEIIGTVIKINDRRNSGVNNTDNEIVVNNTSGTTSTPNDMEGSKHLNSHYDSMNQSDIGITSNAMESEITSDSSKWFVMAIENDFSEIQFYRKGFFVKQESILKAIRVARVSGKTVRLSSQKCAEKTNGPQFGIYAIPNVNECCVFVGPYEKHEPLGIETVKSELNNEQKRTRGVWIRTNKIDNLNVIDNPLSFMPQLHGNNMMLLESDNSDTTNKNSDKKRKTDIASDSTNESTEGPPSKTMKTKIVKPIKIYKTNGFYHLTPTGRFTQIPKSLGQEKQTSLFGKIVPQVFTKSLSLNSELNGEKRSVLEDTLLLNKTTHCNNNNSTLSSSSAEIRQTTINGKPIAEIAPQIKIMESNSISTNNNTETKTLVKGMFVLKPEEINKRLAENKGISISETVNNDPIDIKINNDIEKFLATSEECSSPTTYIISDDDDKLDDANDIKYRDVWIQCKNIENLGWIRGRKNADNKISFEFPGFKFTEYYTEKEAFTKINQVMSRKVYVPRHINMEWQVIETKDNVSKNNYILSSTDLSHDFIMTKRGLRHKHDMLRITKNEDGSETSENASKSVIDQASYLESGLEEESCILEDEGQLLWKETLNKQTEIMRSLSDVSDDFRRQMSEKLKTILTNVDSSSGHLQID